MSLDTAERIHRREALNLMEGRGAILDAARDVSALARAAGVSAPVIGGLAVVLHGHWRSTRDIDLFAISPIEEVAKALAAGGFQHDPAAREFLRGDGIPIHLVTADQTGMATCEIVEIEGVLAASLPALIEMKLRSGASNLLRAQDLADVIGLVRRHRLGGDFARHLDRAIRPEFRKITRALRRES